MESSDFGQALRKMRNDSGKSVSEVSEYLISIGYKAKTVTIYGWERGVSLPSPDALLDMCRFYGVTDILSYFGDAPQMGKNNMSQVEKDHLKKYRALDEHGKEVVDTNLELEYKRCEIEEARRAQEAEMQKKILAQLDELKRQNQEMVRQGQDMAADIAAIKEEDAETEQKTESVTQSRSLSQ